MKKTQNYNLNLPESTDVIDINDLNSNTEFIDKELYKKADKAYVDTQIEQAGKVKSVNGMIGNVELHGDNIKYNSYSTINEELKLKANTWELSDKADKNHRHSAGDILESKTRRFVSENQLSDISKISSKADKSYVDRELEKKADQSYVDEQVLEAGKVSSVNGKAGAVVLDARDIKMNGWTTVTVNDKMLTLENLINTKTADLGSKIEEKKADKKYVDDELSGKASVYHSHSASSIVQSTSRNFVTESEKEEISKVKNKVDKSYVDEELDKKASKSHSHSATSITETTNRKFVTGSEKEEISKVKNKADKSYVDDQIIASSSTTGIVSTSKDRSVISSDNSNATSKNSTIIASEGSKTNQVRSAVIASKNSETDGANYSNRSGNVILASHGVKTPSDSRNLVVGGSTTDINATPSTSNIKWKLDGLEGTLWVDSDVEIGNMKVKNKLESLSNSSTIVIANHDSHPNSKDNADIVINKGENAGKKINDAIQSLKGTSGEVKLMEGIYNMEYGIAMNIPNVHLTGIPGATILKQSSTWGSNPINDSRYMVSTAKLPKDAEIFISNIAADGHGFWLTSNSQVMNCTSNNSGGDGFYCVGNSQITSCTSNNSGGDGFYCGSNSQMTNCTSSNSDRHGFYCVGNSQITSCTSDNSDRHGFYCLSGFKGIVANNILKNDTFEDKSSSPAIVQNNIIWEGE